MTLYFAYGANLNKSSMKHRCPAAMPVRKFELKNWQLDFSTHATIIPTRGSVVPGALWHITDECETSLDYFEGYPIYYCKKYIQQDGIEFMVYVMNGRHERSAPHESYLNIIKQGYVDWSLDFNYVNSVVDRKYFTCYNNTK